MKDDNHESGTQYPIISCRRISPWPADGGDHVPKHGISARAREIDGEVFVLKGSDARHQWTGPSGGYQNLFGQLLNSGVLSPADNGLCFFTQDQAFSSPSAAAAIVAGSNQNGRTRWTVDGTGQTYGAWQDEAVIKAETEADN